MTSQEIETWISENRPEPPRGSAVCGESCACAGGTSGTTHQSACCQATETAPPAANLPSDANDAAVKPCRGFSDPDGDLSRPDRRRFEAEGVAMEFVTAVDYDHLCHRYDEVCQQLRESEAARGEQMRTIEVLAAECRAWRESPPGISGGPYFPHCRERSIGPCMCWQCKWADVIHVAQNATKVHAPARRLVEGEQHEH